MDRMTDYTEVNPFKLTDNVFDLLDNQWTLVTAGSPESMNTMTAAWGGLGILWKKAVATIYIRPHRYTYEFLERSPGFTLSFFDEKYRKALQFCGAKSGRDFNKPKETGLTPVLSPAGNITFMEARMIFDCQKIYVDNIKPQNFIDSGLATKMYPLHDYHRIYIGEILKCYRSTL